MKKLEAIGFEHRDRQVIRRGIGVGFTLVIPMPFTTAARFTVVSCVSKVAGGGGLWNGPSVFIAAWRSLVSLVHAMGTECVVWLVGLYAPVLERLIATYSSAGRRDTLHTLTSAPTFIRLELIPAPIPRPWSSLILTTCFRVRLGDVVYEIPSSSTSRSRGMLRQLRCAWTSSTPRTV